MLAVAAIETGKRGAVTPRLPYITTLGRKIEMMKSDVSQAGVATQEVKPHGGRFKDRTGIRYGRLVAVRYAGAVKKTLYWECLCDCGNTVVARSGNLNSGHTRSCGCLKPEALKEANTVHGGRRENLYSVWCDIKKRCRNRNAKAFSNYGGRGIQLASEFEEYAAFRSYVEEQLGDRPSDGHSLDRIDNDMGYRPGNLRWATRGEQNRNRRTNRMVMVDGRLLALIDACEVIGIPYNTVKHRLYHKRWPIEKALSNRQADAAHVVVAA